MYTCTCSTCCPEPAEDAAADQPENFVEESHRNPQSTDPEVQNCNETDVARTTQTEAQVKPPLPPVRSVLLTRTDEQNETIQRGTAETAGHSEDGGQSSGIENENQHGTTTPEEPGLRDVRDLSLNAVRDLTGRTELMFRNKKVLRIGRRVGSSREVMQASEAGQDEGLVVALPGNENKKARERREEEGIIVSSILYPSQSKKSGRKRSLFETIAAKMERKDGSATGKKLPVTTQEEVSEKVTEDDRGFDVVVSQMKRDRGT